MIELLVVISIIALLIAILLPALSSARWQAKVVVCSSQARQIHIGLIAYATDANGDYMAATAVTSFGLETIKLGPANGGPAYDTRDQLQSYIVSPETFYCPDSAVSAGKEFGTAWGGWDTTRTQHWISYAILGGAGNRDLGLGLFLDRAQTRPLGDAAWFDEGIIWVKQENDVTQPSRAPFLADVMRSDASVHPSDPGVFQHNHSGYITPETSPIAIQADQSEGFSGGNSVYFDGHGEWKQQKSMSELLGPDNDDDVVSLGDTYYAF